MTESPAELKPTDTDPNLSDKNKDKQEQKLEPDPKALPTVMAPVERPNQA